MEFPAELQVGPWSLHPHPLFELLAYSLGFQLFLALRRERGDPVRPQRALLVLATIVGALLGAKLLAWTVDPPALWARRGDWQAWLEGKTIVGGLLGGLAGVELAKKALGVRASSGDLYAIPLTVGIAVGRLGCFLTGLEDRTYGSATSLPWAVDFGDGVGRHPTQLYEVAFLLLVLLPLLLAFARSPRRPGDEFRLFMVGYLGWRLAIGFIQPGWTLLGLESLQWASLAGLAYYARDMPRLNPFARPEANHA